MTNTSSQFVFFVVITVRHSFEVETAAVILSINTSFVSPITLLLLRCLTLPPTAFNPAIRNLLTILGMSTSLSAWTALSCIFFLFLLAANPAGAQGVHIAFSDYPDCPDGTLIYGCDNLAVDECCELGEDGPLSAGMLYNLETGDAPPIQGNFYRLGIDGNPCGDDPNSPQPSFSCVTIENNMTGGSFSRANPNGGVHRRDAIVTSPKCRSARRADAIFFRDEDWLYVIGKDDVEKRAALENVTRAGGGKKAVRGYMAAAHDRVYSI